MNQESVKEILEKYTEHKNFVVIFSGKKSGRVDGLYKPDTKEIIIHNKNFEQENTLMYTAFHELAHHIDFESHKIVGVRSAHGNPFWVIFDNLIEGAVANGDYEDLEDEVIQQVVLRNHEYTKFLKSFGTLLIKCVDKCHTLGVPFEDVVRRKLRMKKGSVVKIMKMAALDIPDDIGGEMAKSIAGIAKGEDRQKAIEEKKVLDKKYSDNDADEYSMLRKEKERIQKTLDKLHDRLEEVDLILTEHDEDSDGSED